MKAERRHELKTNALARGLEGVPDYWREYGSRILLVVLVAAIVFLLVRYWNDKKATDARLVAESVETASTSLQELQQLPAQAFARPASAIAEDREKLRQQADQAINTILNTTKDPKMLVAAYRDRGDLNWALANFPETPGSTTLPSSQQLTNRDAFLDQAKASYEKVLTPAYNASAENVFAARMGLAAIAENQGKWDEAKSQYQAIADAANMPASFKELAGKRLSNLTKYQTSALLVPPPEVAPLATTAPATSTSQPTASSSVTPETSPASSQPTTRP
jgi:predicted negative regulator of RcsB-dependent stress response